VPRGGASFQRHSGVCPRSGARPESWWFVSADRRSIEDGKPIAEEWLHRVEKLRDPSHVRFLSPGRWTEFCNAAELSVIYAELAPFKQPDLNWYFETAARLPKIGGPCWNWSRMRPDEARALFKLGEEDGRLSGGGSD